MPAWASSWARIEPKNRRVVSSATPPATAGDVSGYWDRSEKVAHRLNAIRAAMIASEGSTRISTPPIRPMRHPLCICPLRSGRQIDPLGMGVHVEPAVPEEPNDRHAQALGGVDGQAGRGRHGAEQRDPGHRGLLDQLE